MLKKTFIVMLSILLLSLGSCKKKEEKPVPQAPMGPGTGVMMPPGETKVVVPEAVKGKWDAVKLVIEDKTAKKTSEVIVKLDSEYTIPNSNLKVKVGEFLPDFKMDGLTITSSSNEPNNPAVRVVVYEGGKEIFKGWLYSKFPTIHPFQHDKYGITLKEGIRKG
jgi:hypothetical protein